MSTSLSDSEYRQFREWLVEQYGLEFAPQRRDILRARLEPSRAALGFADFAELLFHLKFHPDRDRARERLLHHLTNNESYFFRETAQLDVLRDELLPEFAREIETGARSQVRILSAACAAGEEPYTIAMVVDRSRQLGLDRVRITGIDVDAGALERARAGEYGRNAFRRIPDSERNRYFTERDGVWHIDPRFRESVRFRSGNLVDPDTWRGVPRQDVVFCRNVLIYFTDEAVRRAVHILHDALVPGGRLFLGHAETLSRVPTPLVAERRSGAVFYRRPID